MDYRYKQPNKFSSTSCIMGISSLVTMCTGLFSIPLGALGILFAVLSKKGKKMDPSAKLGCTLSGIGLVSGLALTLFVYISTFTAMFEAIDYNQISNMTEEEAMDYMMESIYGPNYKEIYEQMGIDYDQLMDQLY
ncbi:MAG: hypothetical protein IJY10_02820 [Lachnospiraceae bacterium]|nr:hypothetical protein [Lachnospiraceae bacterium]